MSRALTVKACFVTAAVVAVPFLLEATTGCSFTHGQLTASPNSWNCACTCGVSDRDREIRVSANADDAEQATDASISLAGQDLDFLTGRYVGLRFRDVGIPQGATIVHAFVQFTGAPGSNTGALDVLIDAEAVADAPAFTTTAGSIAALPKTGTPVSWSPVPTPWGVGEAAANELTPDLAGIVHQIVNQSGWASGNALVLTFQGVSGAGLRKAYSRDGRSDLAAKLAVHYIEPGSNAVGPQTLRVCAPPDLNPNLQGGTTPSTLEKQDFCATVGVTLSGLDQACGYPSACDCNYVSGSDKTPAICDLECIENPVNADCSDFDPKDALVQATNARRCSNGANFGEICQSDSDCTADPVCGGGPCTCMSRGDPVCVAELPSFALAAAVFGRRTTCDVAGSATIKVGDEDPVSSDTTGIVNFVGDPCPGASCAAGIEYDLNVDPIEVGNFFHSETFSDLGGLGGNMSGGEAVISSTGDGTFAQNALAAAAQGRRGDDDLQRLSTTNGDGVDVKVGWGQATPECSVHGTLAGTVDPEAKKCDEGPDAGTFCEMDSDCAQDADACSDGVCNCVAVGDEAIALSLDVNGMILNQPPAADAGEGQEIECEKAGVTDVVLDGSGSSDLDGNLALFSWLRGSRAGEEVGFDQVSKIEQSLGAETYVLRVIDAIGQADEDTTVVDIVDTTPPVLTCSVGTSVINQTNHDLINVGLAASAEDSCEGTLPVTVQVFGDENDEEGTGDGVYSPDAKNLAVGSLRLRAERKGNADGRVYLIVTSATDSSSNRGFACCTVTVPSSPARSAQASARTQAAAAQAFCLSQGGTAPSGYFVIGDGPVIGPKQ